EVDEATTIVISHRSVEREGGVCIEIFDLLQLVLRDAGLLLKLFRSCLTTGPCRNRLLRSRDTIVSVEHVDRNAYCTPLVGERARDRVTNPPGCVRAEAITTTVVEAFDSFHQANIAFLNQVDQRQTSSV